MEIHHWLFLIFGAFITLMALLDIWREDYPAYQKLIWSLLVLGLPVLGSIIYMRQKDEV